jgi:hypothetical protein
MHDVFKGIVVGFIGFVVWALFSVLEGVNMVVASPTAFGQTGMSIGFALMVGGPVVYILIIPVAGWLRRRRNRGGGGSSP